MSSLEGKVVLVTGGGSGIGLAVARGLLREGAKVAIAGRNEGRLAEAVRTLGGGDRPTGRALQPDHGRRVGLRGHLHGRVGPCRHLARLAPTPTITTDPTPARRPRARCS